MALDDYNKKRKFSETPEPEGNLKKPSGELIFVVQRHSASRLHYDLRLELDGVLKSWAIPKGPSLDPKDKRLAMMTEDHPYAYKDFEGTIPTGNYGAGEMEIWDYGTYEALNKVDGQTDSQILQSELKNNSLKFILKGQKLEGEFALVKIKNSKDANAWLIIKHKDSFAVADYDSENYVQLKSQVSLRESNRSGKKKEKSDPEIKKIKSFTSFGGSKKFGEYISPMLCKTDEKAFNDPNWIFEIKWDGYRAIADLREGEHKLYSRNGISLANKFPKLFNILKNQNHPMVLDGEIVAYNSDGKPDFQLLQNSNAHQNLALTYQVFDLLYLNGHSTQNLSLIERKELLKEALVEDDIVKYCDHIPEHGKEFFAQIKTMELEGMIAKKSSSIYTEGLRSDDWLKVKYQQTQDVFICGFTQPKGARKHFGALILGVYRNKKWIYSGHAGTGFSDAILDKLMEMFKPLIINNCPFFKIPLTNTPATWLQPKLMCEIRYTEITKEGVFRHPVFVKLVNHELQESEVEQKININKSTGKPDLKLTNLNKIYFPESGVAKGQIIDYYQSVSEFLLPHLMYRPQSLNRFPNGIDGLSFYHKDAGNDAPDWINKVSIFSESTSKDILYLLCNTKDDLAYLNNLGCIDLNPWNSTVNKLDNPTWLALDLDPSSENTFNDVIETALAVKEVLDIAKIKGYVKTSGRSGIHIYLPLEAQYSFEQTRNFAYLLMQKVNLLLPDLTTLERNLKKRSSKKIYLDYLQNRSGQTLASVYSVRPKAGAPVSMPLQWDELKPGIKPTDFNIFNAVERIKSKGDLFAPVLSSGLDMMQSIINLENSAI